VKKSTPWQDEVRLKRACYRPFSSNFVFDPLLSYIGVESCRYITKVKAPEKEIQL
jgi:hypothetical protein